MTSAVTLDEFGISEFWYKAVQMKIKALYNSSLSEMLITLTFTA